MRSWFSNAPKSLKDLRDDLDVVRGQLRNLRELLDDDACVAVSTDKSRIFASLRPALDQCAVACDELEVMLASTTLHSGGGRLAKRDRVCLYLKKEEVEKLEFNTTKCKQTIDVAINVATL